MVSTAAFHARVRGSVPGLGGLKETKMFPSHLRVKLSIVGSPRDREVACSASDRQSSNFESCVWRTVSSHSSHHPQEVFLAQFSLYVHRGGLKPDSFHFIYVVSTTPLRCCYVVRTRTCTRDPFWSETALRSQKSHKTLLTSVVSLQQGITCPCSQNYSITLLSCSQNYSVTLLLCSQNHSVT